MNCNYNPLNNYHEDTLRQTLCQNIGKMVIIFTNAGGHAGDGFRGMLVGADEECCKLITSIPSAPYSPLCNPHAARRRRRCCQNHPGCATIIPIYQINSIVVYEA